MRQDAEDLQLRSTARPSMGPRPATRAHREPYPLEPDCSKQRSQVAVVDALLKQLQEAWEETRQEMDSLREENTSLQKALQQDKVDDESSTIDIDSGAPVGASSRQGSSLGGGPTMGERAKSVVVVADTPLNEEDLRMPSKADSSARGGTPSAQTREEATELCESKGSTQNFGVLHPLSPIWHKTMLGSMSMRSSRNRSEMFHFETSVGYDVDNLGPPADLYTGRCSPFIAYPAHPTRVVWDLVGFVFIFYDLIIIPLRVFDPPENKVLEVLDWTVLVYWTLNVFMSVQVGYVRKGVTIMDPTLILLHYIKTWFFLDLVVLVPDWYFSINAAIGGDSGNGGDAVRMLRSLRLTKFLRLLRAARLKKILQHISDRIDSEYTGILVDILKMIILLLLVNHFIASFWFMVGSSDQGTNSWVVDYHYDKADFATKYLVSFHWSITQFTPASKVPIEPKNSMERCYAILVVIFALVGFSYMLGSITGSLTQLRAIAEDADKQFWQVRRYMRQNGVSQTLSVRIQRFLEHAYAKSKKRTDGSNIRVLALLSETLRSELRLEIALPNLKAHPLFLQLSMSFMPTLRRISTTVTYQNLARNDVLFFPGETATSMYFLVSGLLKYTQMPRGGGSTNVEWVEGREDWIAEPVLWTEGWIHVGRPMARTESEVLILHPQKFTNAVSLNPAAFTLVSQYAQSFVTWLNAEDQNAQSDIYQGENVFAEFGTFASLDKQAIDTHMPKPTRNFQLVDQCE